MAETTGLTLVFTGNGKGKTTSSLGMAFRAWGQGMRILVLQFIKGGWKYGELKAAEALGERFEMRQAGKGFIMDMDEEKMAEHRKAASEALKNAEEEMASGKYDMIILDEINYAISYGLVDKDEVIKLVKNKPLQLHLVLTGRDVQPEIVELADLVTEMKEIKHPFAQGIKAQKGVEF
jgi:cob(I)alamin adenosyltransferase